ncbi:MAG TPA: hypothetical protein VG847_08530 [Chitinophagaceae bacterium]|nr:hypothetical protein [Chitinophagaceae bacterium]
MRKTFLILLSWCTGFYAHAQFSVKDLLDLSAMQPKSMDHFMLKKGFFHSSYLTGNDRSYMKVSRHSKRDTLPTDNIEIHEKDSSVYYILNTYSREKYLDGWDRLIRSGFSYDKSKDPLKDSLCLFEKANMTMEVSRQMVDSSTQYNFRLRARNVPDKIAYAEDLLQFDTHDYLVSYFGRQNVTDDLYYFSDSVLQKCSVLYMGTNKQAAFIWADQDNLDHLAYIIVSNVMPTKISDQRGVPDASNEWEFRNGLHWGMPIRDMLRLNKTDFYVYGNKSDLAFMVTPEKTGNIDFKKTAIMLKCEDCYGNELFNQPEVSALDIAKANLPVRIFDIILYP